MCMERTNTGRFSFRSRYVVIDNFGDKAICLFMMVLFFLGTLVCNATETRALLYWCTYIKTHGCINTRSSLSIFGTETTIGDSTTQDDMFIRFSDQEDINTYTPTATNTAGTQRLADGSKSGSYKR